MDIAKITFLSSKGIHKEIRLVEGASLIIGKGSSTEPADIVLDDPHISRKHAKIESKDGQVYITDLGSTNGTFINDPSNKLLPEKRYVLSFGDVVTFANVPTIQMIIEKPSAKHEEQRENSSGKTEINKLSGKINTILQTKGIVTIGRENTNDIVFNEDFISRKHMAIEKKGLGKYILKDTSTNGTYVNGQIVNGQIEISGKDKISIGRHTFTLEGAESVPEISLKEKLQKKNTLIIGRSDADIVVKDPHISRKHAEISFDGNSYWIKDLNSTNGTYLNGKNIKGKGKVQFSEKDVIIISMASFKLNEDTTSLSFEIAIRTDSVEKIYPNGNIGLQKTTISIPHKSFVALMGPSGCGKSTLINALNGANPASRGKVSLYGLDLIRDYPILKRKIGYVPQQDIVHAELTVYESLFYAAKLRMPDDTTDSEINRRIIEVLNILKLNHEKIKRNKVKDLSGGQRKRVCIAVELLNNPILLFLDEPTSPLDPETIHEFLTCMKDLCNQGTTVIMVTHKPEDLEYVDKVVFMAERGYPVFYNDRKNLLPYFEQDSILKVYSLLSIDKSKEEKSEVKRIESLYSKWKEDKKTEKCAENSGIIKKDKKISFFRQFFWLTRRYADIKISDKMNLGLLIAQPIIIALLLVIIFQQLQLGVLFLMAVAAIWFGVSNASKEIVGEIAVYKRERMYNLNLFTYLFSKLTILSVIALVQVAIFVGIVYALYMNDSGGIGIVRPLDFIGYMFYISFSATLLGLLLSTLFENTEQVMSIVPIVLMPQIMLAGVVTRMDNVFKEVLSYFMLGRWGVEGLARIQDGNPDYSFTEKLYINPVTVTVSKNINVPCEYTGQMHNLETIASVQRNYTDTIEPGIRSIYSSSPILSKDTLMLKGNDTVPYVTNNLELTKTNALDQLGFYDQHGKLIELCSTINHNLLMVTLLNLFVFIGICIALKRKDSI